jgi:hypothetical protein
LTEKIAEIPFPDSQLGMGLGSSDQLHDESANKWSKLDTLENLQLFKTFRKLLKVTKLNRNKKIRLIFGKDTKKTFGVWLNWLQRCWRSQLPLSHFRCWDGLLKRDSLKPETVDNLIRVRSYLLNKWSA